MAKENTSKKGEAKGSPDQEGSKFTLSKIIENDRAATVLSIILAVIVWSVVTIREFPTITKHYDNVKVEVNIEGTSAESANLQVLKTDPSEISVMISGTRAQIGDLKSEDLIAVADLSNVNDAGVQSIPYTVKIQSNKNIEFEVMKSEPAKLDVEFDKTIEKEIPVEVKAENIPLKKGYFNDEPKADRENIVIKGSQKLVESIDKAQAIVTLDSELDKTTIIRASDVELYSNGVKKTYEQGEITFSRNIEVTIPVYATKSLPLDVSILNAPDSLDVEYFRDLLTFSVKTIDVAAPDLDELNDRKSINVGTINMYEVGDKGKKIEFKAENFLPAGYRDLSNLGTVTITLPDDKFTSIPVMMTRDNIKYINEDPEYAYEPLTSGMSIYIVGDPDQISRFTSADLTAVVDLEGSKLNKNEPKEVLQTTADITINSKFDKVWIYNDSGKVKPTIYTQATKFETNIEETPVE